MQENRKPTTSVRQGNGSLSIARRQSRATLGKNSQSRGPSAVDSGMLPAASSWNASLSVLSQFPSRCDAAPRNLACGALHDASRRPWSELLRGRLELPGLHDQTVYPSFGLYVNHVRPVDVPGSNHMIRLSRCLTPGRGSRRRIWYRIQSTRAVRTQKDCGSHRRSPWRRSARQGRRGRLDV